MIYYQTIFISSMPPHWQGNLRAWSNSLLFCNGFLPWPSLRTAKSNRRSLCLTFTPNRKEIKLQEWFLAAVLQHTATAHYIWQADLYIEQVGISGSLSSAFQNVPSTSPCHLLFCFVSCVVAVCFAADILWRSLVNNFLCPLGLQCSVVTPNSLPVLVSLSPPSREDVVCHSQRCRATPTKVLILQWLQLHSGEKGQDLEMKQRSYINLADSFVVICTRG